MTASMFLTLLACSATMASAVVCNVCKDGSYPGKDNGGVVVLPGYLSDTMYTCKQLYYLGRQGGISQQICNPLVYAVKDTCGCGITPSTTSTWTATGSSGGVSSSWTVPIHVTLPAITTAPVTPAPSNAPVSPPSQAPLRSPTAVQAPVVPLPTSPSWWNTGGTSSSNSWSSWTHITPVVQPIDTPPVAAPTSPMVHHVRTAAPVHSVSWWRPSSTTPSWSSSGGSSSAGWWNVYHHPATTESNGSE